MEKIKTGVPGLDMMLKGGVRRNSSILLTGVPGTGKTLFGMHFICDGAKLGEPGLFLTYEETEASIAEYAESIALPFGAAVEQGMIAVVNQQLTGKILSFGTVIDTIKKKRIQRVFLDSLTLFEYANEDDNASFRRELLAFIKAMKQTGVTLFATSEKPVANIDVIEYTPQDFLFEGLIMLTKVRKGASFERCISIAKMRGQSHLLGIYPFSITEKGIEVYPKQIPFSLVERGG